MYLWRVENNTLWSLLLRRQSNDVYAPNSWLSLESLNNILCEILTLVFLIILGPHREAEESENRSSSVERESLTEETSLSPEYSEADRNSDHSFSELSTSDSSFEKILEELSPLKLSSVSCSPTNLKNAKSFLNRRNERAK